MLILGVVRWFQPVHGYDVRRELLSWHADEWANVAPGSIYHGLKKLAEEGLLRAVATEQVGARPARITYEITDKGEAEFHDLLHRHWWDYRPPVDPFVTAFTFLPALPRDEGVTALRHRASTLHLAAERLDARRTIDLDVEHAPHMAELFGLEVARLRLTADWCERVADQLEKGELPAVDE